MTVIAWDGKILAADKRSTNNGLARTVTKLWKVDDKVVAVSGSLDQGLLMLNWIRGGLDPDTFPDSQMDADNWCSVVVADSDGVRCYETTPFPIVIEDEIWAGGSGRDFALAAMYLGKNAKEAVEVASFFQTDCGNGVDWVEVGG